MPSRELPTPPTTPYTADLGGLDPTLALGRRWRHERPDFWERLSPLGRTVAGETEVDLRPSGIDGFMEDQNDNALNDEEGSWR